jgi:tRNA(Ile)-lysidine synthase
MGRRVLGPAMLALTHAVEDALTADDRALLVACSGGVDSLALAAAAHVVAGRRRLPIAAVIIDHDLQPDSTGVAARAAATLTKFGYADVRVVAVEARPRAGEGPEAAARDARYRALREEASTSHATVLVGHTRDDQAETVLLGLARGSGTRSLAGMASRAGTLLRPLLGLARTTTADACAELGLIPWEDPHNTDLGYARARVRNRVLPVLEAELGPGVVAALARTAELARDDADLLDQLTAQADAGHDELDCLELLDLPRALRRRLIRRWLHRHGAADLGFSHVLSVESLVVGWHGQRAVSLPDLVVRRHAGRLQVVR